MNAVRNPQHAAMWAWIIAALLGCCLAGVPLACALDFWSGGGTVVLAGVCVAVFAAFMAWRARRRAELLARLIAGRDILAHWTYEPELWRRHLADELAAGRSNSRILWLVIGGVLAVPAIGVLVLTRASAAALLGVSCLYLLLIAASRIVRWIRRRLAAGRPPEVIIARDAVLIGGVLHTWAGWGYEFRGGAISAAEPDILTLTYCYSPRPSSSRTVVRIPIPRGGRGRAEEICELLSGIGAK